ncbi:serine/threonine-protein kinase [Myxococcaceae bacterium GXIMD 01537]
MSKRTINRENVSSEALFILGNLRENGRLGRSNKLADVKATLEPSVSIEFDSYFFFLRKFHYIAMDREAQLRLTDQGERAVNGELADKITAEVGEFFADQIEAGEVEPPPAPGDEPLVMVPPPPPELILDETEVVAAAATAAAPPPIPRGSRAAFALEGVQLTPAVPVPVPGAVAPAAAEPARRESTTTPAVRAEEPAPVRAESAPTSTAVSPPAAAPSTMPAPAAVPQAAPAAAAPSKAAEQDLRYQKFDPLGSGPLGTVFKGRYSALGLDVCLKELKDIFGYFSFLQRGEVLKRLKKELCAQAQVRHPGVVQVMDQHVDGARPYYVLELLQGSLKQELDAGGGKGVPLASAVRWFLQMAYGLRAAHAAGLMHHNLKPENVLLDVYGNAKLADFGLGRVVEVEANKGMPQVFVGAGGMVYLAPELIQRPAGKEPGAAADVYGLGILLYEMLTGQIPGRRSPLPSEVNEEIPGGLDTLFDKMTQDRAEQRYPDIDAMLEDFYKAFPKGEQLAKGDLILSSSPKEK